MAACAHKWLLAALLPLAALAAPPANQAEAQKQLDVVRAEIQQLAQTQRKAGTQRDALAAQLATQADALAAAAAALRDIETQLDAKRQALAGLESQRDDLQKKLDAQRGALADLLRAAYTLGHGSDLRVLLGQLAPCAARGDAAQQDCAAGDEALQRIDRALTYSRYFQQDRVARIRSLAANLARLDDVRKAIADEQQQLQATLAERSSRAGELEAQRAAQQKLLAAADAVIQARGDKLQSLAAEERSLKALLERLRDVFSDIPRAMPDERPFAELRGRLPWPLDGAASAQNHGVLIASPPGSKVRAVAHGRVAYANWLRGYGMLLIVDHGDGWMSLYGGNEGLLREVGDWVDAGDIVATSGRGESGVAGLYFGLRHGGQPVDPQPWLGKRRK
jgi:septal ring factor EnvC (AmiA/AmiB activator)